MISLVTVLDSIEAFRSPKFRSKTHNLKNTTFLILSFLSTLTSFGLFRILYTTFSEPPSIYSSLEAIVPSLRLFLCHLFCLWQLSKRKWRPNEEREFCLWLLLLFVCFKIITFKVGNNTTARKITRIRSFGILPAAGWRGVLNE